MEENRIKGLQEVKALKQTTDEASFAECRELTYNKPKPGIADTPIKQTAHSADLQLPSVEELLCIYHKMVTEPAEAEKKRKDEAEIELAEKVLAELPDKLRKDAASPQHFFIVNIFDDVNTRWYSDNPRSPGRDDLSPAGKKVYDALAKEPGYIPEVKIGFHQAHEKLAILTIVLHSLMPPESWEKQLASLAGQAPFQMSSPATRAYRK